jgi:hypothetical protein
MAGYRVLQMGEKTTKNSHLSCFISVRFRDCSSPVSLVAGMSVFADLTGRNITEKCTQCLGYRTPSGRRSNRKVAATSPAVIFVRNLLFKFALQSDF